MNWFHWEGADIISPPVFWRFTRWVWRESELHFGTDPTCCSSFPSRSCRAVQGASGCVWRGSSCLLTRVRLCFTNLSPRSTSTTGQRRRRGPRLDGPGISSGGSNSHPVPPLLLLLLPQTNMHTQTHARTHAHLHICTDVEPPSAPAAPCLAPSCLPPSPPRSSTYYSVYAVTLTPNYNLNLPPFLPGTVVSVSPWVFGGFPPVQSAWRACRFQCRLGRSPAGSDGTWALGRLRPSPHTGPLSSGGGSYQVATPLPLSSRAFFLLDAHVAELFQMDSHIFSLLCFFGVRLFFSSCVRAQNKTRPRPNSLIN